ncbi:MAG: UbiD family decarboxylase [Deltaproteobacteria bacterium]|nr:UbiD family decarboxylase [Deltaproteobacteria bacterium]
MEVDNLRSWIKEVGALGELREIQGANWDLEIGGVADIVTEAGNSPAVLFDRIKGYPEGYRVLINSLGSTRRLALSLGIPPDLPPLEFVQAWRKKSRDLKLIPPRFVKEGPVLENVRTGADVDLLSFPVPRWFELDGGRYIGTGSANITRDSEEGWVNLGTARVMVHDANTVGFYIAPGRHGRIHREKSFARGEPFKVAISVGHDPLIFLAGALEIPYGVCEYDFIGGITGKPVDVIQGEFTGLPIPATAEIVLEGECIQGEERIEGPFGEWTGYYGSSARAEPVVKIHRVVFRNDPIILGYTRKWRAPLKAAFVWDDLEKAGVPDVRGVWYHEGIGAPYLFLVVSIKQRYPGHARQAAMIATQCHAAAYLGRYTVVVDDDIDPSNLNEVMWAVCTRSDPENDIEILRRCWSGPLDPIIPKGKKGLNSRAIIDATRPFEWLQEFPPVAKSSRELREKLLKRWGKDLFGR